MKKTIISLFIIANLVCLTNNANAFGIWCVVNSALNTVESTVVGAFDTARAAVGLVVPGVHNHHTCCH